MSLIRDRYEQAVRFSWLARQPDHKEMAKFIASYYAKSIKLFHGLTPKQKAEFKNIYGPLESWMTTKPTKKQRAYLERWQAVPLHVLAEKRDKLSPLADSPIDRLTLADLYTPIYREFSSVTHFDGYGVRMLELHKAPTGELVLAPDPWWPAFLLVYDILFSLIQCHEALLAFYGADRSEQYSLLHKRWQQTYKRLLGD